MINLNYLIKPGITCRQCFIKLFNQLQVLVKPLIHLLVTNCKIISLVKLVTHIRSGLVVVEIVSS